MAKIKRGQIYDFQMEHARALTLWSEVLESVSTRVKLKQEEVHELETAGGPEIASDTSDESEGGDDDDEVEDVHRARRLQALRTKRGNELRDLQDLQHRVTFMMASANFQLKNEEEENRLYNEAEKLRDEVISPNSFLILQILRHPIRRANRFINRLNEIANAQGFVEIPEFFHSKYSGGVLSYNFFERLEPFVDKMNEQANQLDDWREQIIKRLRLPLLDQLVSPDGE